MSVPTVENAIALMGWAITPERFRQVFRIPAPALISFSGGRSSGLLLWCILVAYDGALPDNIIVGFANTGKEKGATLRFVHEVSTHWGVQVRWVEWRDTPVAFEEVGLNSADRVGVYFDQLIDKKQRLPKGNERWCTQILKVETLHNLMRALGFGEPGSYCEPIGLRHDEGHRILPGLARAEKDGRVVCYPLGNAELTKRHVKGFWWGSEDARYETSAKPQGFDLELASLWGNCDLCFAMGAAIREERVRQEPEVADWWLAAEARAEGTFATRESVATLVHRAATYKSTPDLFADDLDDAECGTWCPTEEAA